jgi:hypothetical protein
LETKILIVFLQEISILGANKKDKHKRSPTFNHVMVMYETKLWVASRKKIHCHAFHHLDQLPDPNWFKETFQM